MPHLLTSASVSSAPPPPPRKRAAAIGRVPLPTHVFHSLFVLPPFPCGIRMNHGVDKRRSSADRDSTSSTSSEGRCRMKYCPSVHRSPPLTQSCRRRRRRKPRMVWHGGRPKTDRPRCGNPDSLPRRLARDQSGLD